MTPNKVSDGASALLEYLNCVASEERYERLGLISEALCRKPV